MLLPLPSMQTLPTLIFLTSTFLFFAKKSTKKCKKEEKGVLMDDIVSPLKTVLIAVNRSAIHLYTIAAERAIHASKRAQSRMVMFVAKSGGSKHAAQKEGFESVRCFNNQ